MNTLPQLSETDQVETPESTSPLRPIRNFSTNGPLPTMAAGMLLSAQLTCILCCEIPATHLVESERIMYCPTTLRHTLH